MPHIPLSETLAALQTAIGQMPDTIKTRQIMLDRLAVFARETEKDLNAPRVDQITALLTLAWMAAAKAENAEACGYVAETWMTSRRATAPAQAIHYYCMMLEHGHKPDFTSPPTPIDALPEANIGPALRAALGKLVESLTYVPRQHKDAITRALHAHTVNVEIHLTAAVGVRGVLLYKAAARLADAVPAPGSATPAPVAPAPPHAQPAAR